MYILKNRFTDTKKQAKFWEDNTFNLLDINLALFDCGLNTQMFEFSWHFAEPKIAEFYNWFELDFEFIKDVLGIPDEYVSRETNFSLDMDINAIPRDSSKLMFDKEKMQQNFEKMMKLFAKETKEIIEKLLLEGQKQIEKGTIKADDFKQEELKFEFIKKLIEEKEKEEQTRENKTDK